MCSVAPGVLSVCIKEKPTRISFNMVIAPALEHLLRSSPRETASGIPRPSGKTDCRLFLLMILTTRSFQDFSYDTEQSQ